MDMNILTKVRNLNDVYYLLMNLTSMTYLTIYQIEYLVKLDKKMSTFVKMANGF